MKGLTRLGIVVGILFMVVGIVVMGSTVGQAEPHESRMLGMMLFSFGSLFVSVPLYLDARRDRNEKKRAAAKSRQTDALVRCFACGSTNATLRCQKHMVRLCTDCVPSHDEAQCFYIPLSRLRKDV